MKKFKWLSVVTVCLLVVAMTIFAGCKESVEEEKPEQEVVEEVAEEEVAEETEVTEEVAEETSEALKIGIVYLTLEHPYYQGFQKQWRRLAEENGFDLIELDGGLSPETETAAVEDLVAQNVDAILFCLLDPSAAVSTIEYAQDTGIPIAAYAIRPGEEANCPFIGYDEYPTCKEEGKQTAELFKELFPDQEAKIIVTNTRTAAANVERENGFLDGFMEVLPDAEVVATPEDDGTADSALSAIQDAISANQDANVFFGTNDSRAQGALAALELAGRGTIDTEILAGVDGSEVAMIELVDPNSAWKVEVGHAIKDSAELSYSVLVQMINGDIDIKTKEDFLTVSTVLIDPTLEEVQK